MRILQINVALNKGSTGRIAEQIGITVKKNGEDSYFAYSRTGLPSESIPIKIGNKNDVYLHVLITRLLDKHGFGSKTATKRFVEEIEIVDPDVIHLHNIHGYYLNIEILFNFLKEFNKPVVWTFHDCWPFTGHCTYFDSVNCQKWKTACYSCPKTKMYPQSWLIDNSKNNFQKKKELFNQLSSLHIITPSNWLKQNVEQSFLKEYTTNVIHNGVDISIFKPAQNSTLINNYNLKDKNIIIGVASIWDKRKGLDDFVALSNILDNKYKIVLIGLSKEQIKQLPKHILGIERTENIEELAAWYATAKVFINPTYQDNFPTTNIEALACGTPVITYDTGGSPEAIDKSTGLVVKKRDIQGLKDAIDLMMNDKKKFTLKMCRERAEKYFNKEDRFQDYFNLYKNLLKINA